MKSNVDKICWKARVKTLDAVAERERGNGKEGKRSRESKGKEGGPFNSISLHATLIFHFFLRRFSNFVDCSLSLSPKTLLHFFVSCSKTKAKKRRAKNESKKILLAKADLNFHLTEANNAANPGNDDGDDDDVNVVNACRWFPDPIVETVGIVFVGIFVVATGRVGSCVPQCVCVAIIVQPQRHIQFSSVRLVLVAASSSSSSLSLSVVQWSMLHYFADPQVMHSCSILFSAQTACARSPAAFTRRSNGLALSPYKTDV